MKYLIRVEYPHEWNNGFSFHEPTLEAANTKAAELAKGKPGYSGYVQVSIYELVEKVN